MKIGDECYYEDRLMRVVGMTYSHRNYHGGIWLQLMPVGAKSLSESMCGIPAWKVEPVVDNKPKIPDGIALVKG